MYLNLFLNTFLSFSSFLVFLLLLYPYLYNLHQYRMHLSKTCFIITLKWYCKSVYFSSPLHFSIKIRSYVIWSRLKIWCRIPAYSFKNKLYLYKDDTQWNLNDWICLGSLCLPKGHQKTLQMMMERRKKVTEVVKIQT